METDGTAVATKRPLRLWQALAMAVGAALLLVLAVSIWIALGRSGLNASSTKATVLFVGTAAAGIVAVVWAGLFILHLRRHGRGSELAAALVLAVVTSLAFVPVAADELGHAKRATETVGGASQTLRYAIADTVDATRIRRDDILGNDFLEPEVLARPGGLRESYQRLAQLRALQRRFDAEIEGHYAEARKQIAQQELNPWRRQRMLAEFDVMHDRQRALSVKGAERTERHFDAVQAPLDFLQRDPAAWTVHNGRLVFNRAADEAAFFRLVAEEERVVRENEEADARDMAEGDR